MFIMELYSIIYGSLISNTCIHVSWKYLPWYYAGEETKIFKSLDRRTNGIIDLEVLTPLQKSLIQPNILQNWVVPGYSISETIMK